MDREEMLVLVTSRITSRTTADAKTWGLTIKWAKTWQLNVIKFNLLKMYVVYARYTMCFVYTLYMKVKRGQKE